MELLLERAYFREATLGALYKGDERVCFTLERPWRGNEPFVSCVPEGEYLLKPDRPGGRFEHTWELQDVPGRTAILFHAGNRVSDSAGCIMPCEELRVTEGGIEGLRSRVALLRFLEATEREKGGEHWLRIVRL